jgi:hypothetical protein
MDFLIMNTEPRSLPHPCPAPAAAQESLPPSTWRCALAGLALAFTLALLLRWPLAAIPLERDEGEYAYIAEHWLLGEVPYRASFDQKPPAVFAAYAVILRWLGSSPAAIHWGAQIYSLGTLALIFLLGSRLFSPLSGLLAALFAAQLMTDPGMWANAANTELFMLLPLTGSFLAVLLAIERGSSGWALLAGVLAGAALLFKQVALFDALFFMLLLLRTPSCRGQRTAAMLLGCAMVLGCCFAYFCLAGAGREFYDCVIGYNLKYATALPLRDYPASLLQILPRLLLTAWPVYLLAGLGLAWGLVAPFRCPKDRLGRSPSLVSAWLFFAFAGVLPGGYFYPHYFLHLVPPLTLLAGLGSVALFRRLAAVKTWVKTGLASLVAAAAIAIGILSAPWYYFHGTAETKCRQLYANNPFPESMEVAQFIREHSSPNESIFVFGSEPQIYYYAQRRSASRYIFVYPLATAFSDTLSRQQTVLEELEHNRPAFVVYVYAPPSFSMRRDIVYNIPRYLFWAIGELLTGSYELTAAIPLVQVEGSMPLITGTEHKNLTPQTPLLLTVWQRRRDNRLEPARSPARSTFWKPAPGN